MPETCNGTRRLVCLCDGEHGELECQGCEDCRADDDRGFVLEDEEAEAESV